MEFIFWLSIFGCFYSYLIYPLALAALNQLGKQVRLKPELNADEVASKTISVIITVRNEVDVIGEKLTNTLSLQYAGGPANENGVQIIVASDGSDDGTDEKVREYRDRGVQLVSLAERGGKERAQREAVQSATGSIVVFTDAKIRLQPDALEKFAAYFDDTSVGAVSSLDRVEDSGDGSSGEGLYVRYEMWLRSLESEYHSLVGLSGSCFAVRRSICNEMPIDIPSDFALLLAARKKGLRGVQAEDVVATYKAVPSTQAEFDRKVRTVLRGISTLLQAPEVMKYSEFGAFAWQVMSHKLMRWLVPLFMAIAALTVFKLAHVSFTYILFGYLMIAFLILAIFGLLPQYKDRLYCKVPLFFMLANAAVAVAWAKYFLGQRALTWTPSKR